MTDAAYYTQNIKAGSDIWMPSQDTVWEQGTVLAVTGSMATVRTARDDVVQLDLSTIPVFLANPSLAADVTALHYINEPGILYNLEQRSGNNEPYTLLGSVLVAVNPLKVIADPAGILGLKKAAQCPHPYGIAEIAYGQMVFAENRKLGKNLSGEEIISNQSIVISGESGSGKTESSKYVLKHLVTRNEHSGGEKGLDGRLLGSNPILESFGNASTLRNHNSSRFGKFLKLHFVSTPRPGDTPVFTIGGASVVTYLLERSRITSHNNGERGYHVFYQLRDGSPASVKKELGLDLNGSSFRYMTAKEDQKIPPSATKMKMNDKEDFVTFDAAWGQLGIASSVRDTVYKALAGILHLGNVEFVDEERPEGNVAVIKPGGYGALEWAGKMLGIDATALGLMFREHEVQAGSELVTKRRDAMAASYARDATAKAVYSQIFEWVVDTINEALDMKNPGFQVEKLPFIGVLDIFGFESFERNDFEQLLINYTNEALQGTFNRQVFVAEMDLYRREGLILDNGGMAMPPDNSACMALLAGSGKTMGLLKVIDAESQTPQANDPKMIKQLHRAFEKHQCFIKPHPKDIATTFIIRHYAGAVVYTGGRFMEKNADRLPKEVGATFQTSSVDIVAGLFGMKGDKAAAAKRAFGGASIIGKFTNQIAQLINTLEATRDSFIRCVKPNPAMVRTSDLSWFDRRYVTQQLKCLSIPQTAEVLKSGLPTRVPYEVLTENYMSVLPADAISIWKRLGKGELRGFMSALFWAFEVPPDAYRTGMTRVFFKSGELTMLDRIMEAAGKWMTSNDPALKAEQQNVVKRFKFYYVRTLWRKAIVKVIAMNKFTMFMLKARGKQEAATRIEAMMRMQAKKKQYNRTKRGALMAQKLWRAKKARQVAAKLRQEAIEEAKRKAEEAKRLEEEARLRAIAEAKAAEAARIQAEKEAAEAAEADKAAAQARLEQMKIEAEQRAKKAAEEAVILKQKRLEAEEEERKKLEEDQEIRKKQEQEYEELQARLEKEEAERAAEEAMEKGRKNVAGGDKPRKSVVREMRKSVSGITAQQKQAKIREAEAKINAEREAWANSGKVGYLTKLEKGGLFGGKKAKPLFLMLRMVARELEIYPKSNSTGLVGEPKGKPKAVYKFTTGVSFTPMDEPKNPLGNYAFELSDPKGGKLQLGCENDSERQEWAAAFKRAASGFKVSPGADDALKKAKDLVVTATGGDAGDDDANFDVSKLPAEAQEQLAKIESLYETGLLTKMEMDQLKPIIIAQGREAMQARPDQEEYDSFPNANPGRSSFKPFQKQVSTFEELGYMASDNSKPVVCKVCSIVNMHGGVNCMICNAELPNADDPEEQARVRHHRMSMQVVSPMQSMMGDFGPPDGRWLCSLSYRGNGVFKAFVKDCVTVMDQQTWSQTALYILGCEFMQGQIYHEQWAARHNWAWFEKWHKKASEQNFIPGMPPFPVVDVVEANSTNVGTMAKLKDKLSIWLGETLACVKDSEAFLKSDLGDKMFKIKDNVQEEINFDEFEAAYEEVLNNHMSAADSSVPLSQEEMQIADDAGTLLIAFIRGDGTTKALDIFDERVQDLHSVCLTAIPRLRASQDLDNPLIVQELVPHALDVLEHLDNALRVYNDSMSIAQAKFIM